MAAPHSDDVILNKAATVERCVARALEEYEKEPVRLLAPIRLARMRPSSTSNVHAKRRLISASM